MLRKIIVSICILFVLTGCSKYYVNEEFDDKLILNIDSINLSEEVSINSIDEYVNGIVLFSEYGRPDIIGSNTIIGAHSGYGSNAYFNYLSHLNFGDMIYLKYDGYEYKYEVKRVYEVFDTDLYVLDSDEFTKLTLLTCKIGENNKRIVVESYLLN